MLDLENAVEKRDEPHSHSNLDSIFQQHPIFGLLSPTARLSLAQSSQVHTYHKSEFLWRQGERAAHLYLIVSGIVSIEKLMENGCSCTLGLFANDDVVGASAALAGISYPADAKANSKEVVGIRINPRNLFRAGYVNEKVGAEISEAFQRSLRAHEEILRQSIEISGYTLVSERLTSALTFLTQRYGRQTNTGYILIPLPLTKTQLALLTKMRVETVIRTLNKWEKQALVKFTEPGLQLMPQIIKANANLQ